MCIMIEDLKKSPLYSSVLKLHPTARMSLLYLHSQDKNVVISPSQEIITGAQLLENEGYTQVEIKQCEGYELDSLGKKFLEEELPEYQVLKALDFTSKTLNDLKSLGISQEVISAGLGELKKNNLVELSKTDSQEMRITPTSQSKEFMSAYSNPLIYFKELVEVDSISQVQQEVLDSFSKRKGFIKKSQSKSVHIQLTSKGKELATYIEQEFKGIEVLEGVNEEVLKQQNWKRGEELVFRHYDISIPTSLQQMGRFHPMHEANDILTDIFVEMGFSEMEGPVVESEFWCFDALWIPQDHPARDAQDTFFIGDRAEVNSELIEKIREMHESGIDTSHTPKGDFKEEVTRNTILRTHSTATTFRTLYELGLKQQQGEDIDGKYFYIAHNFRNEAVDATHLAEFFQAEGILIADDLSLAGLIGFMKDFYAKLGLHKLKFKPTFNPYTEPSMEIHYFDEKMDKWYSIGNSGLFRPETLRPMGLENKRIYGFGLGASRVATLLTGKSNMREITGSTCDLSWIKSHSRLDRKILR